MANRLDKQRQAELEPKRINDAIKKFKDLNIEIISQDSTTIKFLFKGAVCSFFPYSGWHAGKTITDGRGAVNLFKQLK